MNLLEYYQNQLPSSENFVPRKSQLPLEGDINLYGVRGAGKTSIVLDYLSEVESEDILYLDIEDPNLIFNSLETLTLQQYIDKNHIKILVLDHYEEGLLLNFPNVLRLIIITRISLKDKNFTPIELFPLDYEEFLAFESTSATE